MKLMSMVLDGTLKGNKMNYNALHSIMKKCNLHYFEGNTRSVDEALYITFSEYAMGKGNSVDFIIDGENISVCILIQKMLPSKWSMVKPIGPSVVAGCLWPICPGWQWSRDVHGPFVPGGSGRGVTVAHLSRVEVVAGCLLGVKSALSNVTPCVC